MSRVRRGCAVGVGAGRVTENSERTLKLGIISVGCLYAWADSLSVTMGNAYWSSHEFTGVVIAAMCAGRRCATRRRSGSASPRAKYRDPGSLKSK